MAMVSKNKIKDWYEYLEQNVEKIIKIQGKVSTIIWQHIIGCFEGFPYMFYFDLDDFQIVIYSKKLIQYSHGTLIEVIGKVVVVESCSGKHDLEDHYKEYHICAEEIRTI
jgi:hypothetical protein